MEKENCHQFRFYSLIGYGIVGLIVYLITLGFAFELSQRRLDARVEAKCNRYDEEIRRSVGFRKEVRRHMRLQERAIAETGRFERGIRDRVRKIEQGFRKLDGAIMSGSGQEVDLTRSR